MKKIVKNVKCNTQKIKGNNNLLVLYFFQFVLIVLLFNH